MSKGTKLIGSIVAAAILSAAWKFTSRPARSPMGPTSPPAPEPLVASPVATPEPLARAIAASPQTNKVTPRAVESAPATNALNEHALVGTKWQRDGFALGFGSDGKLLIGGRERAQWRVEGSRVRLYRDATGEEHWLDIMDDKLLWEGQELGRAP